MTLYPEGNKPLPEDNDLRLLRKICAILYSASSTQADNSTSTPISNSATALSANPNRKGGSIQNLGTNPLYVKKGATCSTTDFTWILAPGGANDDGLGGTASLGTYTGIVTVAGTSPRYVASQDS